HTRLQGDWSSDVCSSDLGNLQPDIRLGEDRPRGQLPMHVKEQIFDRDRLSGALLMGSNITTDELDQVVEHKAKRELKDGRFRRAPDQALQMKNLGDFLEDLLNPPALQVMFEQLFGRIKLGIHQIGDNRHVRLSRTLER